MTTLADRLSAAIDAAKKDLNDRIDAELTRLAASGNWMTRNDLMRLDAERGGTYAREERRCAADRKILDLLPAVRALQVKVSEEWDPGEPVGDGEAEAILAALAEAYGVEA